MHQIIYKILIILSIYCIYSVAGYGQSAVIGGGPTVSAYFGDMSPFNLKQSWSQVHPGISLYASKKLLGSIYIEADFEYSNISGDDKNSRSPDRKARNLNFKSHIASITGLIGFRQQLISRNRFGITGALGLTSFSFNPKANLDGKWYPLQPLSTEGQGLTGGAAKTYSLVQFAIPIQVGFFVRIGKRLYCDVELTQYFTTTDYLDDVSGNYFDSEIILQEKGQLAYTLADRHAEIDPGSPNYHQGITRGNPRKNDQFAFIKFGISYSFKIKKIKLDHHKKAKCPELSKKWFEDGY